ncbi:hypothetical protein CTA1_7937 [Colletotrichum tanaceti]|uniref:Uncharacterized protein n=1 Tax=Colletotrichum tanaceti TaxID=1306861 RepID=A0A4V6DI28_9PEZI|nr:hypothetical protein CTA1_7937 [Colletotrichum tanaceti]
MKRAPARILWGGRGANMLPGGGLSFNDNYRNGRIPILMKPASFRLQNTREETDARGIPPSSAGTT